MPSHPQPTCSSCGKQKCSVPSPVGTVKADMELCHGSCSSPKGEEVEGGNGKAGHSAIFVPAPKPTKPERCCCGKTSDDDLIHWMEEHAGFKAVYENMKCVGFNLPSPEAKAGWEEELEMSLTSYKCCLAGPEGRHKEDAEDHYIITKEDIERVRKAISQAREEARKELLVEILADFHLKSLEGKGYDFFFVLKTRLDALSAVKPKSSE